MYSNFQLAKKYLHYYVTAANGKGHGVHSPFVFDFILNVINNKNNYQPDNSIEQLRNDLLQNSNSINLKDLGAGSRINSSTSVQINRLAKKVLKSKKYSRLIYRLCRHYTPKHIIELGTSFGITSCYLASANNNSQVITIEGSDDVASIAQQNFNKAGLKNIHLLTGDFDEVLPTIISKSSTIDLAYIDGNHRFQPTVNYFNQLVEKASSDSILIFDDIHWSKEMEDAWDYIKQHPSVQLTIDIFFLGFVFFKKDFKEKQHFSIRF